MRRPTTTHVLLALNAFFLALLALRAAPPAARAQDRPLTISSSCDSDDLVVYDGGSRLDCVDRSELFPHCDSDELVGSDSSGRLRCVGPSSTPWGVHGMLPDCSSGDTLVSEGFGSWRCTHPSH
jgi:hypothetical protein